jgi:hypothetical protein
LQQDVLNLFGNPPPIAFAITVSKTEVVDDDRVRGCMMCENSQTHEKGDAACRRAPEPFLTFLLRQTTAQIAAPPSCAAR